MLKSKALMLAALPFALTLSACGEQADSEEVAAEEMSDDELQDLLSEVDNGATFASIVENSELDEIFEGSAPYTLIVPVDDAFSDSDTDAVAGFTQEDKRTEATLYTVAHILPGFISVEDLRNSIASSEGGSVEVKSMSGKMFTFSSGEGDAVMVSVDDSEPARIVGGLGGNNGGLIMVDKQVLPLVVEDEAEESE